VTRERAMWCLFPFIGLAACWTEEEKPDGDPIGNGPRCYDLNCEDLLAIEVSRRDNEVFVSGEYTFSLGPDEPEVACTVPDQGAPTYEGDTGIMALSLNQARDLFTLRFDVTPREIYLEVLLDDAVIGSETLVPRYQIITSRDPECLETCTQGSVAMTVQGPAQE
jgi:hypothetical protein